MTVLAANTAANYGINMNTLGGQLTLGTIDFTKTDTVTPEEVQKNIAAFTEAISSWFEKLPETFHCSATARRGRGELLHMIDQSIIAARNETRTEPEPSTAPADVPPQEDPHAKGWIVRAGGGRVKGPKRARPW